MQGLPPFNPRSDVLKRKDDPGQGDDVACEKCGAVALDTGRGIMTIKTWHDRIMELEDGVIVTTLQVSRYMQAEIDELRTAVKSLAKDADRYRWIRERPNADSLNLRFIGTDLDTVIDAGMKDAL